MIGRAESSDCRVMTAEKAAGVWLTPSTLQDHVGEEKI